MSSGSGSVSGSVSGSYFQKAPVSDPTFFLTKYDFKGPKMAFQNLIFKEYLNLVYINGQNYEITSFLMVFVNVHIHFRIWTRIRNPRIHNTAYKTTINARKRKDRIDNLYDPPVLLFRIRNFFSDPELEVSDPDPGQSPKLDGKMHKTHQKMN
jgi:hypothetical protein